MYVRARVGGIALAFMLVGALPGIAAASSYDTISGTVTAADTGLPITGISIDVQDTYGTKSDSVLTDSDGSYTLQIDTTRLDSTDGYALYFADPQARYVGGQYYAPGSGHFSSLDGEVTEVFAVGGVATVDAAIPTGQRITGTVTGPGTPGIPLAQVTVFAYSSNITYMAQGSTATDGTYSVTVPADNSYGLGFFVPYLYQSGCLAGGWAPLSEAWGTCTDQVPVGETNVSGVDIALPIADGDILALEAADHTVTAGSSVTIAARLRLGGVEHSAEEGVDVTGYVGLSIDGGGTCTATSCTLPTAGDYTLTGSYGGISAQLTLHAATPTPTPPMSAPPMSAPTARSTPPVNGQRDLHVGGQLISRSAAT